MTIEAPTMPHTAPQVFDRASALAERFRSRLPVTEAQRSIPQESIDDLRDAGVARVLVPAAHGGLDSGIRDAVDITIGVANGCASTGWISWLMMHVPHVVAMFPAEAQAAVWAGGPDVVTAGSHLGMTVQRETGGYRISGRGAFTSGVNNADWVYVGGFEPTESGPPRLRYFLLEKSQYSIADTWDTIGMRGTGSNTVVVDDLFVPESFTLAHEGARDGTSPGARLHGSPTLQLPWVTKGYLGFLATVLGAAQGAHREVVDMVANKRGPGGVRNADSEAVQVDIGMASAKLEAAYTLLSALADRSDAGGEFTVDERARLIGSAPVIVTLVLEVIDKLIELSGTSGFGSKAFVQQAWRDIHFASAHISLSRREPSARYGRLVLGVPEKTPGMFF